VKKQLLESAYKIIQYKDGDNNNIGVDETVLNLRDYYTLCKILMEV
jgi:hypothetical protein